MNDSRYVRVLAAGVLTLVVQFSQPSDVSAHRIHSCVQELAGTEVSVTMLAIPAGSYTIGSPAGSPGMENDERPQKQVTLSAFWMGEKEVTFAEWDLYFKDTEIPQLKNI